MYDLVYIIGAPGFEADIVRMANCFGGAVEMTECSSGSYGHSR